jgi:hypothetical protein
MGRRGQLPQDRGGDGMKRAYREQNVAACRYAVQRTTTRQPKLDRPGHETQCSRQGEYHSPIRAGDLPPGRDEVRAENDHPSDDGEREGKGEPEAPQDARTLDEEIATLDLLLCCLPSHVVRE